MEMIGFIALIILGIWMIADAINVDVNLSSRYPRVAFYIIIQCLIGFAAIVVGAASALKYFLT